MCGHCGDFAYSLFNLKNELQFQRAVFRVAPSLWQLPQIIKCADSASNLRRLCRNRPAAGLSAAFLRHALTNQSAEETEMTIKVSIFNHSLHMTHI